MYMGVAITKQKSENLPPKEWTDCISIKEEIFKNIDIVKFISVALKSIPKLQKIAKFGCKML